MFLFNLCHSKTLPSLIFMSPFWIPKYNILASVSKISYFIFSLTFFSSEWVVSSTIISFFLRMDDLSWTIFKLFYSFLCLLNSAIEHHSNEYVFQLQNFCLNVFYNSYLFNDSLNLSRHLSHLFINFDTTSIIIWIHLQ